MAASKTTAKPSRNGASAAVKAKGAGDSLASAARGAGRPALAVGAGAAGLAGGVALGSRMASRRRGARALIDPRRRVLGVPIGRRSGATLTAAALVRVARGLRSATGRASATTEDVRQIREQLERANRQSPIEVLLDGLTHRRGAHQRET
jgi:hypothetical protein